MGNASGLTPSECGMEIHALVSDYWWLVCTHLTQLKATVPVMQYGCSAVSPQPHQFTVSITVLCVYGRELEGLKVGYIWWETAGEKVWGNPGIGSNISGKRYVLLCDSNLLWRFMSSVMLCYPDTSGTLYHSTSHNTSEDLNLYHSHREDTKSHRLCLPLTKLHKVLITAVAVLVVTAFCWQGQSCYTRQTAILSTPKLANHQY